MSQGETDLPLDQAVGYVLKRAAAALRSAMDAGLRPLSLTVPQYACLELLGQRPGLSNAELARGAFVTRQSMNGVLRGLQNRGLVTRPATAPHGRVLPTQLTPAGSTLLHTARAIVYAIEQEMVSGLSLREERRLHQHLASCAASLTPTATDRRSEADTLPAQALSGPP